MSLTMEVTDLWDGIAAGIFAEAGFKDGDILTVKDQDRMIIYSKCSEKTPELTRDEVGFHSSAFNLKEGECMHINIEYEVVTLSPISRDAYVEMLKRQIMDGTQ